jgi:hypothetical protein
MLLLNIYDNPSILWEIIDFSDISATTAGNGQIKI